ncbi:MAG: hypothetical protein J6V44_07920 [Methanobrevibacter sp.]|nr:hypothetical protein [Methanobrevibacter sp.]
MSVEQMNSLLSTMGVEADVVVKEEKLKQRKPVTVTETKVINPDPMNLKTETKSYVDRYEDVEETLQVAQINTDGSGSEPTVKFIGNGSISPTSKGKSSGGGGKKDSTKKKSDEIERYHTVNKEIESIESKMSRASSAKDNAFGKNKIPYINKEIDALNELIEKHQEYKAEIEKNLKIDAANIAQYGFIDANADGILDNWEAVMERELEAFNKAA